MAPKRREHGRRKGKSKGSASTSASAPTSSAPEPSAPPVSSPPWPVTLPEVIPIKLEGVRNYRYWKEHVQNILISHNLERFLVKNLIPNEYANESDRKNDIISDEYQEWLIQDQTLYIWLLASLSDEVVPIIEGYIHSWEVWNTVNEYMGTDVKIRAKELREELKNIKKTGYLQEYLQRIQFIVDSLAAADDPVSEKEHIEAILNGLPEQYNDCATVIRGRGNPPPLYNVIFMLTVQEPKIEQFSVLIPVESLITSRSSTTADSTDDHAAERPAGPPEADDAPSSSSRRHSDGGRRGRHRRGGRSGRR